MTLPSFLQTRAFGTDEIAAMEQAFANVCATLRISERAGGLTEQVALKITELAKQGEHDPIRLTRTVLAIFNPR